METQIIYQAKPKPASPGMRFQDRDGELLLAIYQRDGVVAKRHLKTMFWADKSDRAMEKRLAKLYRLGYLEWPSRDQWRSKPIPEPICWLGWKGIVWVAAKSGLELDMRGDNETQLRRLEANLRKLGIYWAREPRWIQLEHDLAVIDFRLLLETALQAHPALQLEEWVPEGAFRCQTDVMEYSAPGKDGQTKRLKKGICPDGYFVILDTSRSGGAARARFLLEMDMATHDNPSFGREKVLPGVQYLLSSQYKNRFGDNSGRWLVVTTGPRRLQNLKHQAESLAGKSAGVFYFTTRDQLTSDTILTEPIWMRGGESQPAALLTA